MKNNNPLIMWKNLGYFLFSQGKSPELYDIEAECTWEDFDLGLSQIGYRKEGISRQKRWYETYINESEILKLNKKYQVVKKMKKDYVLLFRFGAKEKKISKAGDFCLIAAVFVFKRGTLKKVNIFYRTVEGVTKFLADLILLKGLFKHYFNFFNMTGIPVKFYFTKVYTRYFHILTFYTICKKEFNEDIRPKIKWASGIMKDRVFGPDKFKYAAAKRLARHFKENWDGET